MRATLITIPLVIAAFMVLGMAAGAGLGPVEMGIMVVLVAVWIAVLIAYLTRPQRRPAQE